MCTVCGCSKGNVKIEGRAPGGVKFPYRPHHAHDHGHSTTTTTTTTTTIIMFTPARHRQARQAKRQNISPRSASRRVARRCITVRARPMPMRRA